MQPCTFPRIKIRGLSGGKVINPRTNSSLFELDQMDTKDYLVIRDMKVGDISEPYESIDENGKIIYKVVTLKSRIEPHKANLQQDYHLFQAAARNEKEKKLIDKWIRENRKRHTYA
jgi:peptidyl-prolyl cis-trans isomerase SurA